jgi:predicted transcriptional regulator
MPRIRTALTLGDWEKLAQSIDEETAAAAPQIQLIHEKLQELLAESRELAVEQKTLDSRKQAVTRRMNEILEEGRKAASALKVNLKHQFGNRNEELLRFGIQPLRGKRRPMKPKPSPDGEASA